MKRQISKSKTKKKKSKKKDLQKVIEEALGQTEQVRAIDGNFFGRLWEESWTYIKTVVDVVREPVLILDKHLRVMAANEPFYRVFQVEP